MRSDGREVFPHVGPSSVKLAAALGADCIQVDDLGSRRKGFPLNDKYIQYAYIEAAAQYGVKLASVGGNAAAKSGVLVKNIDGADGAEIKETLEKTILATAVLNAPILMLPFFWKSYLTETDKEKIENAVKVLRYAGIVGEAYGVTIAMESTLPAKLVLDILDKVNSDWVKVYYDLQNTVHFCNADNLGEIKTYGSLIAQIHIKDGDDKCIGGLPIGTGHARCKEALQALSEVGYEGPLILENDYPKYSSWAGGKSPDWFEWAKKDMELTKILMG